MARLARNAAPTLRGQAGFSLLEALIAVALIAAALLPLLALQGQLTRTVLAVERAGTTAKDMTSALSFLRTLNPMRDPEGTEQLGDAILSWTARPASDERPALDQGGAPGRFMLQLYDIEATITYDDGRSVAFSVRALGWRPTEPISAGLN